MQLKSLLLSTALGSMLAAPVAAAAQDAVLGEVIVTARKRQESILNVPVVETAIPQAQLERLQTTELKDLAMRVPGLSLGEAVLTIGTQVSLRGVGTTTLDAGVDQSVSLNLDGLQLTQGLAYSSAMFDVGLVEVLKGPQALFYGKNSPGGVIAIRTADPTDRLEVIGRVAHEFEAQENRLEAIISGPVNDQLKLRLASAWDHSEGFFRNPAVAAPGLGGRTPEHDNSPVDRNYIVRGTALWSPTGKFDARLKLNYVYDRTEQAGEEQMASCPEGTGPVPGFGIPFLGGGEDCKLDRTIRVLDLDPNAYPGVRNNGTPFLTTNQAFGTLEMNYRPTPELTLTSTTGYYDVRADGLISGTMATFAGSPIAADNRFKRHDFTQELRANSDFAGPLNFTAGGYYQDAEMRNLVTLLGNTAYMLPPVLTKGDHNIDIRSYSAFGQLRWQVVEQVEIAAGARWTKEKRSDTPHDLITGVPVLTPIPKPKIESDNVSPEITVTWRPTDDISVFGSLKKGYKSGSYSITVPATPGTDNSFGDEKVEGGEIGLKTRWLDRRLLANLAFYDYRYQGLQVGASETVRGLPITRTVNAGSALVYGVDFDVAFRPEQIEGLEMHGAVAWNHARFKRLDNAPCWPGQTIAAGCTEQFNPETGLFQAQNLAGVPLVRAPEWQASFGFSYEMPIGHEMSLVFSNENQYSSKYLTNLGDRPDFFQSSFLKTDAALTLRGPNERWEFAVIGKNLGNKITSQHCDAANFQNGVVFGGEVTGGVTSGPAGIAEVACFADRGREIWLKLTWRPFG